MLFDALSPERWTISNSLKAATLSAAFACFFPARVAHAATPEISGGAQATTCVLPDVLCVGTSGCRCTATLVHPRVVIYAAHCGAATAFRFGESASAAGPVLRSSKAMVNPAWGTKPNPNADVDVDWAFSVLDQPVTDVPV